MLKAICYAYASSTYAKRFNRAAHGCYVVELVQTVSSLAHNAQGPFDTIADAEAHCATIRADWSPFTMRAA